MKTRNFLNRFTLLVLLSGGTALAMEGAVTIHAPTNGATLDAMNPGSLNYQVTPGPQGHHAHLYDNGEEIAVLRKLKGRYALDSLDSGTRELCIKVVNRRHKPIGVEQCVNVTIE